MKIGEAERLESNNIGFGGAYALITSNQYEVPHLKFINSFIRARNQGICLVASRTGIVLEGTVIDIF